LSPLAGCTDAEEKYIVAFRDKPWRNGTVIVEGASLNFIHSVAGSALEMVMVFFAGYLIKRTQLRSIDSFQPSGFNKEFQIAVDGGLIQRFHRPAAHLQYFVNTQRSIIVSENFLNGCPLICFSLHFISLVFSAKHPKAHSVILQEDLQEP
jgi:hypothetical protein